MDMREENVLLRQLLEDMSRVVEGIRDAARDVGDVGYVRDGEGLVGSDITDAIRKIGKFISTLSELNVPSITTPTGVRMTLDEFVAGGGLRDYRGLVDASHKAQHPQPHPGDEKKFVGNEPFLIKVTKDGGDNAGDVNNTCDWTYTVSSRGDLELGTEMSPMRDRLPNVEYNEPEADSYGIALYNTDGELALLHVIDETPKTDVLAILTNIRYDATSHKFQYKKTNARVLEKGSEGEWTDFLELTDECDIT